MSADPEHAVQTRGLKQHVDVAIGTGWVGSVRFGVEQWTAFCLHTGTSPLPPAGLLLRNTDTIPVTQTRTYKHIDTGTVTQRHVTHWHRTCNAGPCYTLTQDLQHGDIKHIDTGALKEKHVDTLIHDLQHSGMQTH